MDAVFVPLASVVGASVDQVKVSAPGRFRIVLMPMTPSRHFRPTLHAYGREF